MDKWVSNPYFLGKYLTPGLSSDGFLSQSFCSLTFSERVIFILARKIERQIAWLPRKAFWLFILPPTLTFRWTWSEFKQTPRDSDEQGSLVCCSPWGHNESDVTQQLNNNLLYKYTALLVSDSSWGVLCYNRFCSCWLLSLKVFNR